MYCTKCGNEIDENTLFCPKCGTKVLNKEVNEDNDMGENKSSTNDKAAQESGDKQSGEEIDKILEVKVSEETRYDEYEKKAIIIVAIVFSLLYIVSVGEIIISVISGIVVAEILDFLIISPVFNKIKKGNGCYKAKEKHTRCTILKQTMEPSIALNMVEIEFSKYKEKRNVLYYLLCILVIVLIFALL